MTAAAAKTAHTPGPWSLGEPPHHADVFGADGFKVADTRGYGSIHRDYYAGRMGEAHWASTPGSHIDRDDAEAEANGRLIAAAPDMLAALRECLGLAEIAETLTGCRSDDDYVDGIKTIIEAAISKATANN